MAIALGVDVGDIDATIAYDSSLEGCFDLVGGADPNSTVTCNTADDNTPVSLDGTLHPVPAPVATTSPPPPPSPPPSTFVSGQCGFHLHEEWDAMQEDGWATVTIPQLVDGAGNKIGYLDKTSLSNGVAIDMASALPWTVRIVPGDTGEDWKEFNYYDFSFAYADKSWSMSDSEGAAHCTLGARDTSSGTEGVGTQDMDCVFPC